jgi:hypothetical protein
MLGNDNIPCPIGRLRSRGFDVDGNLLWDVTEENLVTTVGKRFFIDRANAAAGVGPLTGLVIGNGTTPATVGDTALAGGTTYYQAFDSGFPTRTNEVATYRVTLALNVANFPHSEFGLTTASSGGILVTRLLSGPFTKNAQTGIVYDYTLTQQ